MSDRPTAGVTESAVAARRSGDSDGEARQLQTAEARKTGGAVHRPRRRRADAEKRREGRVRLVVHRNSCDAGRVDGISDRAVVEEAIAELADDAFLRRTADLRLTAAAGTLRSDVAGRSDARAAHAGVQRGAVAIHPQALERRVRAAELLERST